MSERARADYAAVKGPELYYEIHGEPLILLHGGVRAIEMFGEVLPMLAEGRQVIGVDLQAYGRTADIDRPMMFESMSDDVAALIGHRHPASHDALRHLLFTHAGIHRRAVSRRSHAGSRVMATSTRSGPSE